MLVPLFKTVDIIHMLPLIDVLRNTLPLLSWPVVAGGWSWQMTVAEFAGVSVHTRHTALPGAVVALPRTTATRVQPLNSVHRK